MRSEKWLTGIFALGMFLSAFQIRAMETFSKTFVGEGGGSGNSARQTKDGGYIITGTTYAAWSADCDIYLAKMDGKGVAQWEKIFDHNLGDQGNSVEQTTDGGYIIIGTTNPPTGGGKDIWLIKTNDQGNVQWNKTFDRSFFDWGYSIQQTTDGGYIIGGASSAFGSATVYAWLLKTDNKGVKQWDQTYKGFELDSSYSVRQTKDGGYIVLSNVFSNYWTTNVYLIKTDSKGVKQWDKVFGGDADCEGYSVRQTTDGGYIIAGKIRSFLTNQRVWLIKVDSGGSKQWDRIFAGDEAYSDAGAFAVDQTTDGGYIIVGQNTTNWGDLWLIKTDSFGIRQWDRTFGGSDEDQGNSVKQTTDGGYIIGGSTSSFDDGSIWLIKTDPNGSASQYSFFLFNTSTRFSQPAAVNAVCADGGAVTRLDVSVPSSLAPGGLSLQIVESGAAGEDGRISITGRQSGKIVAVYTAPDNFCRTNQAKDAKLEHRPITIKVLSGSTEQYRFLFPLYRPPVVLLHGLWTDSRAAWGVALDYLTDEKIYPSGLLYAHDYGDRSADSLFQNSDVCDEAIQNGLAQARRLGYSSGKVDLVAHSMGGLLGRIYLQDLGTHAYRGDIHKFVTIGTPHSGSQAANYLVGCTYLQDALNFFEHPTNKGAVTDLCVDSWRLDHWLNAGSLNKHKVPSHAIIGKSSLFGGTPAELFIYFIAARIEYGDSDYLYRMSMPQRLFGEANDLIAAVSSQGAGLATGNLTSFDNLSHLAETDSDSLIGKLVELFNSKVNDPTFASTGFKPPDLAYQPSFKPAFAPRPEVSGGIRIVPPVSGTVVNAGNNVTLQIEVTGATTSVMLVSDSGVLTKTAGPFTFSVRIPTANLGTYPIVAVGFAGQTATAIDCLQLQVATTAKLVDLEISPPIAICAEVGFKTNFRVIGKFSDGVEREVTPTAAGTHGTIANTKIATLIADGTIQGQQVGETALTVSNNGLQRTLIVSVTENTAGKNSAGDWSLYR